MPDLGLMQDAGGLVIPGSLQSEYDVDAAVSYGSAMLFREWLKEIDHRLDIVWSKESATNLPAGRWLIVRRNEGAPNNYFVVQGRDGGYADPGPEHIEMLQKMDSSRRPGLWHEYRKRNEEAARQGVKLRAQRHEEFRAKLEERLKSAFDTSVAITAEMKARADGHEVTQEGVVLPKGVEQMVCDAVAAEKGSMAPEAAVDDELAAGGIDDFAFETVDDTEFRKPNRQQRRSKRNKALTKARERMS